MTLQNRGHCAVRCRVVTLVSICLWRSNALCRPLVVRWHGKFARDGVHVAKAEEPQTTLRQNELKINKFGNRESFVYPVRTQHAPQTSGWLRADSCFAQDREGDARNGHIPDVSTPC